MAAITLHTDTYVAPSVRVLVHKKRYRVAILCDQDMPKSVAIALFPRRKSTVLLAADRDIKHGGLMGKTFRTHGFTVGQNRLFLASRSFPRYICEQLGLPKGSKGLVEIYEFFAGEHCYGVVIEYVKATAAMPPRPSKGSRLVRNIPAASIRMALTHGLTRGYLVRSRYYAKRYSGTLDA